MKIVINDNLEIPIEQIGVVDITENHRVIIKIMDNIPLSHYDSIKESLQKIFYPAKVVILNGNMQVEIVKTR